MLTSWRRSGSSRNDFVWAFKQAAVGRLLGSSVRRQAAFFQENEALEVVTGCLQLQSECGAHDAKASHHLAAHFGQRPKYMLDPCARCGDRAVKLLLRL